MQNLYVRRNYSSWPNIIFLSHKVVLIFNLVLVRSWHVTSLLINDFYTINCLVLIYLLPFDSNYFGK